MRSTLVIILLLVQIAGIAQISTLETNTKGREFWLGFMKNYGIETGVEHKPQLFITSEVNTQGKVRIPQTGFSEDFTVSANQTTTIELDYVLVEHFLSEVIENKGILIETDDDVSVFAINFIQYTADGMKILPTKTLGSEYTIMAYQGWGDNPTQNDGSMFLIVATEDSTEIEIVPSAETENGNPALIPFRVMLHRGQSYQVITEDEFDDFTGTQVYAAPNSGLCKPFAVFSGASCPYIPTGCVACDHITDQNLPSESWGKAYHLVPWSGTGRYTYKIVALEDNTTVSDNGTSFTLNKSEYKEVNGFTGTATILANRPIAVAQFMESLECAGDGDPAMVILNADNQFIDNITFSTVQSNVITRHHCNVVTSAANRGSIKLDGSTISSAVFTPFSADTGFYYAILSLTAGSHTLTSSGGFIAYVYGFGNYETYAYSAGANVEKTGVDSVLCTTEPVTLRAPSYIENSWWTTRDNLSDTLGLGDTLRIAGDSSQTYVVHGMDKLTQCETVFLIQVNTPQEIQATLDSCFSEPNLLFVEETNGAIIRWFDEQGSLISDIQNPLPITRGGTYYVEIDFGGVCSYYDTIDVAESPFELLVPNIFTPNNDGYNDYFELIRQQCVQHIDLQLYNRWGRKIYETHTPDFRWDGDEVSDGLYFYHITYDKGDSIPQEVKGWIQVLR